MSIHNRSFSAGAARETESIAIEVRFIASLTKFSDRPRFAEKLDVPAETTVGDLIARYRLPLEKIVRVLCNGRDMNPGVYTGGNLDLGASISDGDVITFAGDAPVMPGTSPEI